MGNFFKALVVLSLTCFHFSAHAVYKGVAATENDPEIYSTIAIAGSAHQDSDDGELCSGVLISEDYILTAAHCFVSAKEDGRDKTPAHAYIAILDKDGKPAEQRESLEITLHPLAQREVLENLKNHSANIEALHAAKTYDDYLKVASVYKLNFSSHDLAVVKLPTRFTVPHKPAKIFGGFIVPGAPVVFAGYGDTDDNGGSDIDKILQLAGMKIQLARENGFQIGADNGAKVMPGDSGGPMYIHASGEIQVVAINISSYTEVTRADFESNNFDNSNDKVSSISLNLVQFKDFLKPYVH